MNAPVSRQLPSWTKGFFDYTENLAAPSLFRRWGALMCISGALERHVWTRTGLDRPFYPSMFACFVAGPGIGKGLIINEISAMWKAANLKVGPATTTPAGMIDFLVDSKAGQDTQGDMRHTALFAATELGLLIPEHDLAWLNMLNDLYDNLPEFVTMTRGLGKIVISNPCTIILGGSQPKFMARLFPEEAYGMGFMSRLIMVYAGAAPKMGLFERRNPIDPQLRMNLENDLKKIAQIEGEYLWSDETQEIFGTWYAEDMPPRPTHARLQSYNARRMMHTAKLSMLFAAAEGNELVIRKRHFLLAQTLLLETESLIPEIFKEMERGEHGVIIEETYMFIAQSWMASGKKPVKESIIVAFLTHKCPVNMISFNLETLIRTNLIRPVEFCDSRGVVRQEIKAYEPVPDAAQENLGRVYD